MKDKIVIASYGGSGSTYLAEKIQDSKRFHVHHSHASPLVEGEIGIPVFNRITGGSEGPFSKAYFLDSKVKIIVVVRKPSEAYDSRAGFKHFCHLWSDSNIFYEQLGKSHNTQELKEKFNERWKECLDVNSDIMGYRNWLDNWITYSEKSHYDILFLRYEDILNSAKLLSEFLGIEIDVFDFSMSSRTVKNRTKAIFSEFDKYYDELESKIVYSSKPQFSSSIKSCKKIKSNFHLKGLTAGFGDCLSRISKVHACIEYFFESLTSIERYQNYHCKELDFFSVFNLESAFSIKESFDSEELTLKEFSYYLLYDPSFFKESNTYTLDLSYIQDFKYLNILIRYFEIKENLYNLLDYVPSRPKSYYFGENTYNVVAHFRRGDIIGGIFLDEVKHGPIGMAGLHARKLVTWNDIDEQLNLQICNKAVEIVLVSDGIPEHIMKLGISKDKEPELRLLMDELNFGSPAFMDAKVVRREIGNSFESTIVALDTMYYADLVVSGSSVFPNLICRIGKTKLIKV